MKKIAKQKKKSGPNYKWIIRITLLAFIISLVFSSATGVIIPNVNTIFGIIIVIIFILLGVIFDMVGIAVASSAAEPFHSMSSKKLKGSKVAVKLLKNAHKVSSFCNDVVGDICSIISGSTGIMIASNISLKMHTDHVLTALMITALIAAVTIGGKALGKSYAINKSNYILYEFAKIISYVYEPKK